MKLFPKLSPNARMCLIGMFVFGLFGIFMFPWMIWSRGRVEAMLKWPAADAEIVATDTKSRYRKSEGTRYQHMLTYRFVVSNQSYVGDRVSYGGSPSEWRSEAEARRALPALGSKVRIRYNPTDPSDSVIHVIRTSDSDESLLRWIVAGVALAGGGLMAAAGAAWRRETGEKAPNKAPEPTPGAVTPRATSRDSK